MTAWWPEGIDPWTLAIAMMAATSCSLVGCFLVLRRMSMLGDAISHAVLPGIVLAYLFTTTIGGISGFIGAVIFGVLTAVLSEMLSGRDRLAEDSSMGVVFTTLFAIGVILISTQASRVHIDPDCVLYGILELAGFDTVDLWGWEIPKAVLTLAPMTLLTIGWILLFWKELKIISFDPALATAMGINAAFVHYLLMAMVAGVTVASFEAVGSILVVAMLIVPAATAHLLTDRLWFMVLLAAVVANVSACLGYYLANATNTNSAGMMAVVAGAQFALAVFLAPQHGLATRLARQSALTIRIIAQDFLANLYRREETPAMSQRFDELAGTSAWSRWIARRWLLRRNLIASTPGGSIVLTDEGRREASELVRSHRLWESFLGENFDLPKDHLHAPAHRMEHYIGPELREEIAAELEDSHHDPHGRAIPEP